MNKFAVIGIVLVIIVAGGMGYKMFTNSFACTPEMGEDKSFTIVSKKLEWRYEPGEIEVTQCDRIHATVINEDNFDHGFAIDAFGVSQRLPANGKIEIDFVATQSGTFPFYCSVSCSASDNASFGLKDGLVETGPYKGTFRGHFEHVGEFIAKAFNAIGIGSDASAH